MKKILILFAWYFLYSVPNTGVIQVGPFASEDSCNAARTKIGSTSKPQTCFEADG